ncbi:DUF6438 domain-containing protein [Chryseobacterium sp. ERMR1:04]|uniref:DUF6438 domain-containing protein n=1 Tax=Chryseobacterium sp. ERMR1:04 TaxID=1705393 RepID=UPI0006C845DA|nr:DUF6438 domain-containing protein [Chryseobacterium sp. ERMR1:04]KPH12875.1 hypothetical protein AMQ68_14575 [Chryseobacterium sp. ERMR1:04]
MKYLLGLCAFILLFSCNSQKVQSQYSKIEYKTTPCFGFCPVATMIINSDRTAVLEAEHFNFTKTLSKDEFSQPREGTFTTTIKEADYNKLVSLLNGLDVKNLNEKYGQKVSDLSTSYLTVNLTDDTSKKVEDYGKRGSEKLVEVYKFFEDLKHNQQWTKVK